MNPTATQLEFSQRLQTDKPEALVRIEHLSKLYPVSKGLFTRTRNFIHAVDDVSFEIKRGEVFGLIGESGCGKTTTGKLLVKLTEPTKGHIYLRDQERYPLLVTQGDRAIGAVAVRAPQGLTSFNHKQMTLLEVVLPGGESDRRRFLALLQQLRQRGRSDPIWRTQGLMLRAEIGDSVYSLVTPEYASTNNVSLDQLANGLQHLYYGDIATLEGTRLKNFRRNVQMIFQDPYESLNPRMTIFDIVNEPLAVQGIGTLVEREERVAEMLEHVGLTPAASFMFRFPHELSGGQRQRVAIARAMVLNPSFIVADEPTSMLDVSIRIGVMNLMLELREEFQISYLYITHDLAVARYMCDRIAVMYLGKIVEMGPTDEVIQNPLHPYTRALISAVPIPDPTMRRQPIELKGSVTKPIDPPPRCRFYERCPLATQRCTSSDHPPLVDKGNGHWVACYEV